MTNAKNRGNGKGLAFIEAALLSDTDECIIWPFYKMDKGYGQVGTAEGPCLAHRYVCIKSHGEPTSERPQAAHSCGNSSCINTRHLSWKDQVDNEEDKRDHGTWLTRMGGAKLNEENVIAIRADSSMGMSVENISKKYETPLSTIRKVVGRHTWKHI